MTDTPKSPDTQDTGRQLNAEATRAFLKEYNTRFMPRSTSYWPRWRRKALTATLLPKS